MFKAWILGLTCAVGGLFAVSIATAQAAEETMVEGEHYKCYRVIDAESPDLKVKLKDQFVGAVARVRRPAILCNPVDKNGEGIIAEELHEVCYIIESSEPTVTRTVLIGNQFGAEQKMLVERTTLLCVPSRKELLE